jgi:hypothetical protein
MVGAILSWEVVVRLTWRWWAGLRGPEGGGHTSDYFALRERERKASRQSWILSLKTSLATCAICRICKTFELPEIRG